MSEGPKWFDEVARRTEDFADEQRECYSEGLSEPADEFFADRAPWLAESNSALVVANSQGSYDVAIRIDGSYADRETAQAVADLFQATIYGHLTRIEAGSHPNPEYPITEMETAVARAIYAERFEDRQLADEPTDTDVDQVRHLAKAAIRAITDLRTVEDAGDVPVRAVAYNKADGSIVARFDEGNGVVFGDERPAIHPAGGSLPTRGRQLGWIR